ncbi:hypothetical protein SKAU_G00131210 [Synaphobranchus kaupii]|uniref:Uncharacterized protein n=1 Tax=Synaphobranchus kaupii TaxID=118154 RepID=A0A9Q1FR42_SYNKA|nr:hypothetical protein SKAU_G00131210 [Synaphobranchus kaupii]
MLGADGMENHFPAFTRVWLKDKILTELPSVKSVLQKNRRKPAVLYSLDACEEDMVHSGITSDDNDMDNMKTIFKTAQIIRKSIADFKKEKPANVIPVSSNTNDVPSELYTMIRWIITGPVGELETGTRTSVIDRMALGVSQNILYGFKSNKQVKGKPSRDSANFRHQHARENAQVLGLALTVHHDTRNKTLMGLLNTQGYCVSYDRTQLLETALANAVVENTKQVQGLYVPPFLKKGTFVFFTADNTDFAEDTADGKGTTHGTIVAVYQKADAPGEPIAPPLTIGDAKSLSVTPYHVQMMHCDKPKPQPNKRTKQFAVNKDGISGNYQLTHLGWVIAYAISRLKMGENSSKIPCWAGYNSLLSASQPVTQIGSLPLLPEVAHEWSTLLTVIMQTSELRRLAVGDPTVISFDMALYEKVVQLLDARPDLKRTVVPRLGELHAVMAALRALGTSIENSGIDDAWIEADVYGPATMRQILKCTHYKRSLQAHIYSYVALYELILEEFFRENPQMKEDCWQATEQVDAACSEEDKSAKAESAKQANTTLLEALATAEVVKAFNEWEAQKAQNGMFRSIMNYLHRVETVLFFVAAMLIWHSIWKLQKHSASCSLLLTGSNTSDSGPDTLLICMTSEPIILRPGRNSKQMKVHSGLIGISNNANARQRFFMATPELSCLSREFKSQFGIGTAGKNTEHPGLGSSDIRRDHEAIDKIKAAILSHGNPVTAEGDKLYNMITHAYVPQEYVPQILNINETGQKLYEDYVSERINGEISIWAPVKKENNKMFMSGNKKSTVKIRDKTVDLKETKDLYGRLLILARSNRQIDQKQAVGNYEFTQTPRALFAPNGDILPCTDK